MIIKIDEEKIYQHWSKEKIEEIIKEFGGGVIKWLHI